MTTIEHPVADPADATEVPPALVDWVTSTDHKKIGRLFVGASLVVGLAGIVVGLLLGVERIDPTANIFKTGSVPQLFSAYRFGLTFGLAAPLMLGLAIAVVPLQLGARSLAFPRLAAAGFWTWLVGVGIVVASLIANGGPGGGRAKMVDLFLAADVLVVLGLLAAAISVAATVLTTRAPGMNLRRAPLFAWSALVGSLGLILMLPVLAGALVLLYLDHRGPKSTFGGNDGVATWIGFAWTQPQTLVYAIPALGVLGEIAAITSHARLKLRGVLMTTIGVTAVASFAGVSQVSAELRRNFGHLSANEVLNDLVPYLLFNVLPLAGVGGALLLVVVNLGMARAKPNAALLLAFVGALLIALGLAANAVQMVGDAKLGGTVFEEGAWFAVMSGTLLAGMAGLLHWSPKLWGRVVKDLRVLPLAAFGILGALIASGVYFIAGFAKQPAWSTIFDYSGPERVWNVIETVGVGMVLVSAFGFVSLLMGFAGKASTAVADDPWNGQTLEWATPSPAPDDNFAELFVVRSSAPLLDAKAAGSTTTSSEGAA